RIGGEAADYCMHRHRRGHAKGDRQHHQCGEAGAAFQAAHGQFEVVTQHPAFPCVTDTVFMRSDFVRTLCAMLSQTGLVQGSGTFGSWRGRAEVTKAGTGKRASRLRLAGSQTGDPRGASYCRPCQIASSSSSLGSRLCSQYMMPPRWCVLTKAALAAMD